MTKRTLKTWFYFLPFILAVTTLIVISDKWPQILIIPVFLFLGMILKLLWSAIYDWQGTDEEN